MVWFQVLGGSVERKFEGIHSVVDGLEGGEFLRGVDLEVFRKGRAAFRELADLFKAVFVVAADVFARACDGEGIKESEKAGGQSLHQRACILGVLLIALFGPIGEGALGRSHDGLKAADTDVGIKSGILIVCDESDLVVKVAEVVVDGRCGE